jgi:hypothetical protein
MPVQNRPRIGDFVEVPTPAGLGYVQYSARDPQLGSLVRVLPGTSSVRPSVEALAQLREVYSVFLSLGPAVSRGLVQVIGRGNVPSDGDGRVPAMILGEIWNVALLAERMAKRWSPGGPRPTYDL